MNKPYIIHVDDQRDVLAALLKHLKEFKEGFHLTGCESGWEDREELYEIEAAGDRVVLLIRDHIMSDEIGVGFLSDFKSLKRFEEAAPNAPDRTGHSRRRYTMP